MPKVKRTFEEAEEVALPSTDEEDEQGQDEDTCNQYELEKSFQTKYQIADESVVSLKNAYIVSLCTDGAFTRLIAGLTNGEVQIFDINGERSLCHSSIGNIPAASENENVCGVKFLEDSNPDCLLIGTTNGLVKLFDLRTQRYVANFEEDLTTSEAHGRPKNITCFDRNANSRILCTGTEQYQNSVFLIFYDIRQRKQMGGYCEAHQDDITSLGFHTHDPDLLCSGSTDGLINIFNIKENNEDDALQLTINTESSVSKLNWHKNVYEKDVISCITHTNDFKLYECEEGDLIAEFEREQITAAMKRKNPANCNPIRAHSIGDGDIFLLTGTNFNKGEALRSLRLQNKNLVPLADFDGNKQIVRESIYNNKSQALITAGESAIITLWTPSTHDETTNTSSGKVKSTHKLKSHKKKPY